MDEQTTQWDAARQAELNRREASLRALTGPETPPQAAVESRHGALMQQARLTAAEHCLKAFDGALQDLLIGRHNLPGSAIAVAPFGVLTCRQSDNQSDIHSGHGAAILYFTFALTPGKMVNRSAILAYEQRLVTAYAHPASLNIFLQALDGGGALEVPGPSLDGDTLIWQIAAAQLGGYWRQYRPRLDCFLPLAQRGAWNYQLGQAASTDKLPSAAAAPEGSAHIFSVEEEGPDELVVGIEWQSAADHPDFETFRQALGNALGQMRIPYTCVSEFAASGRIYLSLAPADRPRLEACIAHFNQHP